MRVDPDIKVMRMLRALDSPSRIKIIELIINSSHISFTKILSHLEEQSGKKINKGTLSYHLGILVQSNVLTKELERGPDRDYSKYDITEEAEKILQALGLLVEGSP